ncbi:MAG TPA: uroporphyrinogen-III synthase [Candidatus Dormibacteraeota bacterium]|nr:uroporphyrinogen-III synthase [Candidatus Dormibacteraeota bacterium]
MQTAPLKSLAGVRILITRSEAENQAFSMKLRALGAVTVELPTIAFGAPEDLSALDRAIKMLSKYDWVVFTSRNGVRFFGERMAAMGEPAGRLREVKVAAIGPATAAALESLGKTADYLPEEFLSEEIVCGLGDVNGKRILLPRADIASRILPEQLRKQGASVEEVVAYRTVVPEDLSLDRLLLVLKRGVDVVTFTSPSTVRNLADVAGAYGLGALLRDVEVACIGPVTADAAKALGVHVSVVASNHTVDGLVEAIVNEIRTV